MATRIAMAILRPRAASTTNSLNLDKTEFSNRHSEASGVRLSNRRVRSSETPPEILRSGLPTGLRRGKFRKLVKELPPDSGPFL